MACWQPVSTSALQEQLVGRGGQPDSHDFRLYVAEMDARDWQMFIKLFFGSVHQTGWGWQRQILGKSYASLTSPAGRTKLRASAPFEGDGASAPNGDEGGASALVGEVGDASALVCEEGNASALVGEEGGASAPV